jgi:hypothetical protein
MSTLNTDWSHSSSRKTSSGIVPKFPVQKKQKTGHSGAPVSQSPKSNPPTNEIQIIQFSKSEIQTEYELPYERVIQFDPVEKENLVPQIVTLIGMLTDIISEIHFLGSGSIVQVDDKLFVLTSRECLILNGVLLTKEIVVGWIPLGKSELKFCKADLYLHDPEKDIAVLIPSIHRSGAPPALSISSRKIADNDILSCFGFCSSKDTSVTIVQLRNNIPLRITGKDPTVYFNLAKTDNAALGALKGGPVCLQNTQVGIVLGSKMVPSDQSTNYILPFSSIIDILNKLH